MTDLTTTESMIVQAYGMYLDKEEDLEFATRDGHRRQLVKHFENPDQEQTPPHFTDAVAKLSDYTS